MNFVRIIEGNGVPLTGLYVITAGHRLISWYIIGHMLLGANSGENINFENDCQTPGASLGLARDWVRGQGVLVFLLPEWEERVDGVDYLIYTIRIGIENFRVSVDAYHGHTPEETTQGLPAPA